MNKDSEFLRKDEHQIESRLLELKDWEWGEYFNQDTSSIMLLYKETKE